MEPQHAESGECPASHASLAAVGDCGVSRQGPGGQRDLLAHSPVEKGSVVPL